MTSARQSTSGDCWQYCHHRTLSYNPSSSDHTWYISKTVTCPCHGRLHVTCAQCVHASHLSCIVTSQFSHIFVVVVTDWSRSLITKTTLHIEFLYNLGRDHCKCCSESRRPRLELWLLQSVDQRGGKLTLPCLYFYEYGEQITNMVNKLHQDGRELCEELKLGGVIFNRSPISRHWGLDCRYPITEKTVWRRGTGILQTSDSN